MVCFQRRTPRTSQLTATSGWDFATGIGSVNANNLVMAFGNTPTPTATPAPTPKPTKTPKPKLTRTPTPTKTPKPIKTPKPKRGPVSEQDGPEATPTRTRPS